MGFHLLLAVVLLAGSAFRSAQPDPTGGDLVNILPISQLPPESPLPAKPQIKFPTPQPAASIPKTPVTPLDPLKLQKGLPHQVVPNLLAVVRPALMHPANYSGGAMREPLADPYQLAIANLKNQFTTSTQVEIYVRDPKSADLYAATVKAIYQSAWMAPDDSASDDANTKVSVTIGSDGWVIRSRMLDPSGDARVDASVQRMLDRVNFVAPFPDGAKEKERTYIINFNLKAKRMLG